MYLENYGEFIMSRRNRNFGQSQQPPQNAPQMKIDVGELDNMECERCNNVLFQQVYLMKKVSALVSPTGQEGVIPIPGPFACVNCGHINSDFLPKRQPESPEEAPDTPNEESGIITTNLKLEK